MRVAGVRGNPFDRVLSPDSLAEPLRIQFFGGGARLSGSMDVVWHRSRLLRPLLALLARCDVLFPETGRDVPAEMRVIALPGGHQLWARRFWLGPVRRFDAVMAWNEARETVVERAGPFELDWRIRAAMHGELVIETGAGGLIVRGCRLRLPRLLLPRVVAVERADGPEHVHVLVTVSKWPLGEVFGYSGTFAVEAHS